MATSTNIHTLQDPHSTSEGGRWSTRSIAVTALFCALSFVTSYIEIPIFPPAPWLTYDPSCIIALVAGLCFGAGTGTLVIVLSWLLRLLFTFNPWGTLMAVICNISLVAPASAIYRHMGGGNKALVTGLIVGAVISLVSAILSNIVVTPLYTATTVEAVIEMIVPILIPFNLIKLALNCVIGALVMNSLSKFIGD